MKDRPICNVRYLRACFTTIFLASFVPSHAAEVPDPAIVQTGLDVAESDGFSAFRGKRVGLIANQTAVNRQGVHAVELLRRTKDVHLNAIFTSEHGFGGQIEHGQTVRDGFYAGTNIPIYSLYGKTKRPTEEALQQLDALIFDMQDVGARFYTYVTTLGYCLEEAAKKGIEFYVLDRPNPIGGTIMEGEALDASIRHFTAYYSIPARHGMTFGEIARWHNKKARLDARLTVIPLKGWNRRMLWEDTGIQFISPSPNIRTPRSALLYCGIGAFESTNVAVGRGTTTPFEVFGAPWMNAEEVARRLSALSLPGAKFRAVRFSPAKDLYAGEECSGVQIVTTDPVLIRPVGIFVHAACLIRDLHPNDFKPRWEEMPYMVGSSAFERLFLSGASAEQILKRFDLSVELFQENRKPFLIYPG